MAQANTFVPALLAALLIAFVPQATAQSAASPAPVDPSRFGEKAPDSAFGAFQRGLYITALNIALPRAREGDAAAQTLVADIYARGLGVPQNPGEAAKWYEKAAAQGVAEAQFQFALILMDGKLVPADPARARSLMQAAADAGNRLAQFNLAQLIIDQEPGEAGLAKAVVFYEKAANAGLADAQYAMSQILANGVGGKPPNEVVARTWLSLAARQNFDTAQVDLASWLIDGIGGPRDLKAGFLWMRRAAQGGNVAAQNRLAKLYVAGIGTEPDGIEGAAWYINARRAGLADAYMDDFMQGLTEDEQKQAIERANRQR